MFEGQGRIVNPIKQGGKKTQNNKKKYGELIGVKPEIKPKSVTNKRETGDMIESGGCCMGGA